MNHNKQTTIVIGSKNPVKANAIARAHSDVFGQPPEMRHFAANSGVSDQPMTDDETLRGAENRVQEASSAGIDGDYFVGVEGGIEEHEVGMLAFAWIVISDGKLVGRSRTATFPLPEPIARLIREGVELGKADDIVFGVENSKQDCGAVGLLTNGAIDRESLYRHAAAMAFIPFLNRQLFE